ncbi:MAG: hypothetical protein LKJ80_06140 [Oscillibacter sp.]|nr:hypothetical protein [Oscillibacter sp.]
MTENTQAAVPELLRRQFGAAYRRHRVILLHGPCGCGKTVVARELL